MTMRTVLVLMFAGAAASCVAENFCAKRQECNDRLERDSQAVCVEQFNTNINMLRANREDRCHHLANAQLALAACAAALDCDDFEEGDLGGHCDDERDAVEDAQRRVRDGDCTTFD
jgi:hypothetical protein